MYRCENCKTLYEEREDEAGHKFENCPRCGDDSRVEVRECEICGEAYAEDEGTSVVCDRCYRGLINVKNCYAFGETIPDRNRESIKINPAVYATFDEDEIKEILHKALVERETFRKMYAHSTEFSSALAREFHNNLLFMTEEFAGLSHIEPFDEWAIRNQIKPKKGVR